MFSEVRVKNFRSILDSGPIELGPVSVLIGRNNSGKSALLHAIYQIQEGSSWQAADLRLRGGAFEVELQVAADLSPVTLDQLRVPSELRAQPGLNFWHTNTGKNGSGGLRWNQNQANNNVGQYPSNRPAHLVVPVLARRKSNGYDTNVNKGLASMVGPSDHNMTARIQALIGDHAEAQRFREITERVIGMPMATFLGENGPEPGRSITLDEHISLNRMGEGVSGVMSLATELASGRPRLFLVEEPETDLHPHALRELLQLMLESTALGCQFVVSTHSDQVLRSLGGHPGARVYRAILESSEDGIPLTNYLPLVDTYDRLEALSDLGYEGTLPTHWLLLEESSAQTVIEGALIPIFVPRLAGLRCVSAGGTGNVTSAFNDLRLLMVFTHLEDKLDPRAWVLVDGDPTGVDAVAELTDRFTTWPTDRFRTFAAEAFERYYPSQFQAEVARVLTIQDARKRMIEKGVLAQQVRDWALSNEKEARPLLETSAAEVIDVLREIEAHIRARPL